MSLTGNIEGKTLNGKINKLSKITGYSAYEIAVINGFSGTEEEWLASMKGEDGDSTTITLKYGVSSTPSMNTVTGWQDTIPQMSETYPYLWIEISTETITATGGSSTIEAGIIGYYSTPDSGENPTVELDTTLTQSGKAADAKAVGDALASIGGTAAVINYDQNVKAINHRGFNWVAPENTIPAFIQSKKKGFTYVECDVAFTSDGVPVLLHNDTIDATSDGSGKISEMTYAEASQYDYGSWKSAEYAGTHLPTLDEFLLTCKALGLHPYIEIKSAGTTQAGVESIVAAVKNAGMRGKVTYISFNTTYLGYVKNVDPAARLGLVTSGIGNALYISDLQTDENEVFIDCDYNNLTEAGIEVCKNANVPLEVWTVNSASVIENLDPYISGVTSDNLIAGKVLYDKYIVYTAPGKQEIPATGITLSVANLTFSTTEAKTITATVEPSNTTDPVVWASSANGVASVNNGVVTPVANGTAVITATAGSVSAQCSVTVEFVEEVKTYTVTNNLTNVSNSNSATSVIEGASYTARLAAASGYTLDTVTVTMGGVDITETVYANGVVNIANVTGAVVITASAVEAETSLWKTGYVDMDGTINPNAGTYMYYDEFVPVTAGQTYSLYNTDNSWTSTDCIVGFYSGASFDNLVSRPKYYGSNIPWIGPVLSFTIPADATHMIVSAANLLDFHETAVISEGVPELAVTMDNSRWTPGYSSSSGGIISTQSQDEMVHPLVSVEPGATYQFSNSNSEWATTWIGISFYSELSTSGFIKRVTGTSAPYEFTVPDNAKYALISSRNMTNYYATATLEKVS